MPGYADLFDRLFERITPLAIARRGDSPATLLQLGITGLSQYLQDNTIRYQTRTIERVLAWAKEATQLRIQDGPLHHAVWTDLYELYQHFRRKILVLEQRLASDLARTPYVRLLAISGINVVSAAELAGEMGPMHRYANANAITGRSGLYPSRHQSDQTDHNSGAIIRQANRRLRTVDKPNWINLAALISAPAASRLPNDSVDWLLPALREMNR
jgi:hypothetical protein